MFRPGTSALLLLLVASVGLADWKPARAPLMTRWAKDVKAERVHPEYPRPQMVREHWQSLNGLWELAFARAEEQPPLGKKLPEQILVPFPVESALSGVMKRAERLWYRRTFEVPKTWKDKRILLHFGAVDWEAKVWVNGKKVGEHRGGYDPFTFEITDALKADGPQELIVGVWDPTDAGPQPRGKQVRNPRGIYYTPTTGIWQSVWLEPVPRVHIAGLKIVPDVDAEKVRITVQVNGATDKHRIAVSTVTEGRNAAAAGRVGQPIELNLPRAQLWSPEKPFLYQLVVLLREDNRTLDLVSSYCGMRKIEVRKDERGDVRLFLNDRPYFMNGPLDQGFWPDGLYTPPTDEALRYDIEITKKLGFNCTRKHVKVEPARWYYWCDKLGLLVWQDMPSGDKSVAPNRGEIKRTAEAASQFEAELKAMIDTLHNHPCIVMWVVFNEGWGQYDTKRLTEWTKKYDPSRLVNNASGWNDMKVGDVHDIHSYPGPAAPPKESARAGVLGEYGGLGLGIDNHTWAKQNWSYRGTASREDLTRKYERLLRGVYRLKAENGLAAAIYTQITDVETEINGLLTYDRAVIKVDIDRVAAANRGDFSRVPEYREVIPTSEKKGQLWRYTLEKPGEGWFKPDLDDSAWKQGPGGFGTRGTPGAVIGTEWKTGDIWLRRVAELPAEAARGELWLRVHHDEDAEIYLNGILAAKLNGFTTEYEEVLISEDARKALKPGKLIIAVHCKQTRGGQYIDVGLVEQKKR